MIVIEFTSWFIRFSGGPLLVSIHGFEVFSFLPKSPSHTGSHICIHFSGRATWTWFSWHCTEVFHRTEGFCIGWDIWQTQQGTLCTTPYINLINTSFEVVSFFSLMRSYFSRLVLAFNPCQGSIPLKKYMMTYPMLSISSLHAMFYEEVPCYMPRWVLMEAYRAVPVKFLPSL